MQSKRIAGLVLGLSVLAVFASIHPFEGLDKPAMLGLGIFLSAVCFWVFDVLFDFVTGMLMCAAWAATGIVPFNVAFSQFSSETWFLLVGALALGAGVSKSGLLGRISLIIMDKFPATFRGQTAALVLSGNIIGPMIPSVTAKCAIFSPFAKDISEKMGYEKDSDGAAGLFGAMFVGFGINGPAFLTSSFFCYTILALLPGDVQLHMTWLRWALSALPWTLCVMILGYIAIQLLYKPAEGIVTDRNYLKQRYAELGPMSRNEKITSVVLAAAMVSWMTETLHGISSALVAIFAVSALLGTGVMDRLDFRRGTGWDSAIFIGCIINTGTVFAKLGIDKWIGSLAGPVMVVLLSNIWVLILAGSLLTYVVRFFIVSMVATFTILTVIVVPFAEQAGFNPWVPAFVFLVATNVFHMFYQNTTYLSAYYAADGMVSHGKMVRLGLAYMMISIIGLLACVPVWTWLGYIA